MHICETCHKTIEPISNCPLYSDDTDVFQSLFDNGDACYESCVDCKEHSSFLKIQYQEKIERYPCDVCNYPICTVCCESKVNRVNEIAVELYLEENGISLDEMLEISRLARITCNHCTK